MNGSQLLDTIEDDLGVFPKTQSRGARVLISGPAHCGRSSWLCELAVALTTGTPFFEMRSTGGPAATLLVSATPELARYVRAAHIRRFGHSLEALQIEPRLLGSDAAIAAVAQAIHVHSPLNVVIDDFDVPLQLGRDLFPLFRALERPNINVFVSARETAPALQLWTRSQIVIQPYSKAHGAAWEVLITGVPYVRYQLLPHLPDVQAPHCVFLPAADLTELEREVYLAIHRGPLTVSQLRAQLGHAEYMLLTLLRSLYDRGFATCLRRPPRKSNRVALADHEKWWLSQPLANVTPLSPGLRTLAELFGTTGGRTPWRKLWSRAEARRWAKAENYSGAGLRWSQGR